MLNPSLDFSILPGSPMQAEPMQAETASSSVSSVARQQVSNLIYPA